MRLRRGHRPTWETVSGGPLAGRQLLLDARIPVWRRLIEGEFEPWLVEASEGFDLEGGTVWDVGAHMGYHTLVFAVLVGEAGSVVAFEPNPANADRIRANLSRNEDLAARVEVIELALSDRDASSAGFRATANVDGTSSGSHLASIQPPDDPAAYRPFRETLVTTSTADALLVRADVPAPALVKLDVEGAEALVLEGAKRLLVEIRPVLLIEVHGASPMFHARGLLDALGYVLELVPDGAGNSGRAFLVARPGN